MLNKKIKLLITIALIIIMLLLFFMIGKNMIKKNDSVINLNYYEGNFTQYKITSETKFSDLPLVEKKGYIFLGWSTKKDEIDLVDLEKQVGEVKEVYAVYAKQSYQLEIDANGGTYNNNIGILNLNAEYEEQIKLEKPSKIGHTFKEWKVIGNESKVENDIFIMGTENSRITAIYEVNKYKVTIDYNGGTSDGKEKEEIEKEFNSYLELNTPTREGYIFSGYEVSGGTYKNGGFKLDVDQDVTIRAKWKKIENNKEIKSEPEVIVDNKKNESEIIEIQPEPVDPKPTESDVIPNSTVVIYYYLMNSDGSNYVLEDTEIEEFKSNEVYNAPIKNYEHYISPKQTSITGNGQAKEYEIKYYYEREKFNLTVDTNGGEILNDISGEYYFGQEILLPDATKNAYNFVKWNSNSGTIVNKAITMPATNVQISAVFNPIEYNITYELNGGTSKSELKKKYTIEDSFTLPLVEKEGYTFNGWITPDNNEPNKEYKINKKSGNLYFVADFTEITYEVLYVFNNGRENTIVNYKYNEAVTNLQDIEKANSEFLGWFDDLGQKVENGYIVSRNNTFTAKFKEIAIPNSAAQTISNLSNKAELEYDSTSDNNLRYVGSNPANYVLFNNEQWRIIGVFNNVMDSNGDNSPRLKLIKDDYLVLSDWSTTDSTVNSGYGVNDWKISDINNLLNNYYYNGNQQSCDSLISQLNTRREELVTKRGKIEEKTNLKNKDAELADIDILINSVDSKINLLNNCNSFNGDAVLYSVDVEYSTGSNGTNNWGKSKPLDFYNFERSNNSSKACKNSDLCNDTIKRSTTSTGRIGLMYVSDYAFAIGGSKRNQCINDYVYTIWDKKQCLNEDWLIKDIEYTMSESGSSEFAYRVFIVGKNMESTSTSLPHYVRPVVYLNSKVTIESGNGTIENPYILGKGW